MNTEQKHHAIAALFAAIGAVILTFAIMQMMGGWTIASRAGFFGGAIVVGMCAFAAYALYVTARFLLARRVGVKYVSPHVSERVKRSPDVA